MKRRQFVTSLGTLGTALLLPTESHLAASSDSTARWGVQKKCSALGTGLPSWQELRKQFLLPENYVYLNTGGLGASPKVVINKVTEMMELENTNPNPGYEPEDWHRIKSKCAALLGASVKKEEISLVSTATEGINIILNGLPLKRGDEVIMSSHEHVALSLPLIHKKQQEGIVLKIFEPDLENGMGNLERIKKLITARTRLIFTSHVTCTTGQIIPAKELGRLARAKGIWFALDGAQAVGNIPVNIADLGVDFYTFSGHKWVLGPNRTGVLYVREELRDTLVPQTVGAYSDDHFCMETLSLTLHPHGRRYEYGTQNEALFFGLERSIDFLTQLGPEAVRNHGKQLAEQFYKELQAIASIEILSPKEETYRSNLITFRFKDKVRNNSGRFYQKRFRVRQVPEAGLNGIRISWHLYNSPQELKRLLTLVKKS